MLPGTEFTYDEYMLPEYLIATKYTPTYKLNLILKCAPLKYNGSILLSFVIDKIHRCLIKLKGSDITI